MIRETEDEEEEVNRQRVCHLLSEYTQKHASIPGINDSAHFSDTLASYQATEVFESVHEDDLKWNNSHFEDIFQMGRRSSARRVHSLKRKYSHLRPLIARDF